MIQPSRAIYAVSLLLVVSCSNASESSSQRVKKPGTSDQTGGTGGSGSDSNLSCDQQWSLAVQQQKVGAVFVYAGTVKGPITYNVVLPYTRTETVTAASDAAISRKIDVSTSISVIASYVEKLKTPQLTLTKDKFLQTCNKADGQPVTVTGLGGNISIGSLKDESITLKSGKNVVTKRVDAEVKSVTLGSYSVGDADVVIHISKQYPVLPLKQTLTLNQVSETSLNGAVLEEEIVNGLPAN
jgi:hypothetical protein